MRSSGSPSAPCGAVIPPALSGFPESPVCFGDELRDRHDVLAFVRRLKPFPGLLIQHESVLEHRALVVNRPEVPEQASFESPEAPCSRFFQHTSTQDVGVGQLSQVEQPNDAVVRRPQSHEGVTLLELCLGARKLL